MEDTYGFTYDQVKVKSNTRVLVNGQSSPVNILGYNPLPLINVIFLSLLFRNLCHQEHYHLEKHSTTQQKPMQVGWFSSTEEESKRQISLVLLSIHRLSAQATVSPSPSQAANAKKQVAYTTLICPFPILRACNHLESSNLCRCKVWEGTLSPYEVRMEGKWGLNILEQLQTKGINTSRKSKGQFSPFKQTGMTGRKDLS